MEINSEHMEVQNYTCHGYPVQRLRIRTQTAASQLGRSVGDYYIVQTGSLFFVDDGQAVGNCLAEVLERLLAPYFGLRLLVCGLGNPEDAGDRLGPATVDKLPAFFLERAERHGPVRFEKLVTFAPGVEGRTNLETKALVSGVARGARADCLLLLDAIGTTDGRRLCNSVQFSTAGGMIHCITGSKTDFGDLGLPVISVGVPVVLSARSLRMGASLRGREQWLFPCSVRDAVEVASALLAYALAKVCYPGYLDLQYAQLTSLERSPSLVW